jgi:hypothetical protein
MKYVSVVGAEKVFTIHDLGAPTSVSTGDFGVEVWPDGVVVTWNIPGEVALARVHRDADDQECTGAMRPCSGIVLAELDPEAWREGQFIDHDPPPRERLRYWLEVIRHEGETTWFGPRNVSTTFTDISDFERMRSHPNPSGGKLTLELVTPTGVGGSLQIVDVQGRLVRHLRVRAGSSVGGRQFLRADWDGRSDGGEAAGSGIYYAAFRSDSGWRAMSKIVLMR